MADWIGLEVCLCHNAIYDPSKNSLFTRHLIQCPILTVDEYFCISHSKTDDLLWIWCKGRQTNRDHFSNPNVTLKGLEMQCLGTCNLSSGVLGIVLLLFDKTKLLTFSLCLYCLINFFWGGSVFIHTAVVLLCYSLFVLLPSHLVYELYL